MALTKATNSMISGAVVNVLDYGAVGDGVTDDTAAIQAALDTGKTVYFPEASVAYLVSTIYPLDEQTLFGDGRYANGIQGDGTGPAIQCGDGTGAVRQHTLKSLKITNSGAGNDAVFVNYAPNFYAWDCNINGTSSANGIRLFYSWRATIRDCSVGSSGSGSTAIDALDNVNGLIINGNTIGGGSAGRAIRVGQCQGVGITNNIIESSLDGIWIASTSDTGDGNCNGVNVSNNYIEQSSTPIVLGKTFTCLGVTCNSNYIGNSQTSVVSTRTAAITFGRIKDATIKDNSIYVATTEDVYNIYLPTATGDIFETQVGPNYINGTPANVYQTFGTYGANASVLRTIGGRCYFTFANNYDSYGSMDLKEYVSNYITANAGETLTTWMPAEKLSFGGKVWTVEIVEADGGALTGATLQIGRTSSVAETVNQDLGALTLINGYSAVALAGTSATISKVENNTIQVVAGTGTGKFRVRIRYRAN